MPHVKWQTYSCGLEWPHIYRRKADHGCSKEDHPHFTIALHEMHENLRCHIVSHEVMTLKSSFRETCHLHIWLLWGIEVKSKCIVSLVWGIFHAARTKLAHWDLHLNLNHWNLKQVRWIPSPYESYFEPWIHSFLQREVFYTYAEWGSIDLFLRWKTQLPRFIG